MLDLLKSEWVRFRLLASIYALVHFIALAFMARVVDLAQQPLLVHWVIGCVYALTGGLLGLYQLGSYRKPSQWLHLLHRPTPHWQVAAALFAASALLLFIAVALPMGLIALYQNGMTARIVDVRHWLLPWAGWLIALCAFLAGAFASLRGPRMAAAAVVLLAVLIASRAYGFAWLGVGIGVCAWLAWLAFDAFKPDLNAAPRTLAATAALALPLSMAMYAVVLLLMVGAEMVWIAQGSHPNNTPTPPRNGLNEVKKADPQARMIAALRGSTHADAALLREQIRMSEPVGVSVQLPKQPQRNELANFKPMEFDDGWNKVRWVFSHDDMRFHGYSLVDNRAAGRFGVGAAGAAFPDVVLPGDALPGMGEGDAVLVGGNCLYQYLAESKRAVARMCADAGEVLLGAGPAGESLVALSDKALYFFDSRPLIESSARMAPRMRAALPGAMGDLLSVDLIELVDGQLIALTYGARSHAPDGAAPFQVMMRVQEGRKPETLHVRALGWDYPAAWRYRMWWPTPGLYALSRSVRDLGSPGLPLDVTRPSPVPRGVWMLAWALSLLSGVLAFMHAKRSGLDTLRTTLWAAFGVLLGLPGFATMYLLVRPVERP